MPVVYTLVIFVVLTIFLSILRSRLVYEISGASLLIFGSTRPGIIFYTVLFLPGTIIHELSHWIVAEILQVRTGTITIFPDFEEGEVSGSRRLGSVAMERSDPIRGFLIGAAPFFSGLIILAVLGRLLSIGWAGDFIWWQIGLIIYGIMVIGNTMMISESDRRAWPFIIILFAVIVILFNRLQLELSSSFYLLTSEVLYSLNLVLGVTAGLNLVMIVGSYVVRRLIQVITRRKLIHK